MFFINRPLPLPLESLEGYKNRLGKANYYDDKYWPLPLLPISAGRSLNSLSNELIFLKLAELTLLDVDRLVRMTLHHLVPYFYDPNDISKLSHLSERFPIPLWEVSKKMFVNDVLHDQDKICPLCWREHHTHFLPWLLRPITTCIIHQTVLIDTCTQCGTMLQVNANTCPKCGINKDELLPTYLEDPLEIMYTDTVWKSIGAGSDQLSVSESVLDFPGPGEITPPQFFKFLWKMGTLLSARDKNNPYFKTVKSQLNVGNRSLLLMSKAQAIRSIMAATYQILSDWPDAWFGTLERIAWYENQCKASDPTNPLRNYSFPSKLKDLFNEPEWDWLLQAFVGWIEDNASNGHHALLWATFLERPPYLRFISRPSLRSRKALCREFRIDIDRVNQALKNNLISSVSTEDIAGGRMRAKELVSPEEIVKLQEEIGSFMSINQALEYVGIGNRRQLSDLSKKGLFPERKIDATRSSTFGLYKREVLEAALNDLIGNLPEQSFPADNENKEAILFQDGIQLLNLAGIKMADLLVAVRDGNLKAFRDSAQKGLRGLWFHKQVFDNFRLICLHPDGKPTYSVHQVTQVLNCDPATLQYLFKAQVLVPVVGSLDDDIRWKYDLEDVTRFQAEYVTSNQAAKIVGVTQSTLVLWIKKGWLPAVTGRSIDGSRRYRVNKHFLVEWRSNWLDTNQVLQLLGISRDRLGGWRKQGRIAPIEEMGGRPLWYRREDVIRLKKEIENEGKHAAH